MNVCLLELKGNSKRNHEEGLDTSRRLWQEGATSGFVMEQLTTHVIQASNNQNNDESSRAISEVYLPVHIGLHGALSVSLLYILT